jgi:hypothetical protein
MSKCLLGIVCALTVLVPGAFAGVEVTIPANGATVSGPVQYIATATTDSCSKGIASMGIYTAPGVLAYVVNGSSLNTSLTLNPSTYNTMVEAWDNCGGAETTPIEVTVDKQSPGVTVSSPANNSLVTSPVDFYATATSTCSKGIASMGIYTAPYQLAYVVQGDKLTYDLPLSPGTYDTVVEEWDNCGGASTTPVKITVTAGGTSFSNVQNSGGWGEFGQRAPDFINCSPSPCENISFSMVQGIKSPSLSGKSTEMNLGGSEGYGDGFWNNHLIGPFSSQGLPDNNHTLVPTLHNFTYDVYFWGSDLGLAQALEFDVNQFFDNMGFIWGHECRVAGGNEWDIWDNVNQNWVPTGVACYPNNNAWNHLTIQVERTSDNQLLYQSITLNGSTANLNLYYKHGAAPSSWYGITVNYQEDGNNKQSPYSVYLDELTFTYQ